MYFWVDQFDPLGFQMTTVTRMNKSFFDLCGKDQLWFQCKLFKIPFVCIYRFRIHLRQNFCFVESNCYACIKRRNAEPVYLFHVKKCDEYAPDSDFHFKPSKDVTRVSDDTKLTVSAANVHLIRWKTFTTYPGTRTDERQDSEFFAYSVVSICQSSQDKGECFIDI